MGIKIPRRFYDDHCERDLEAPNVVRKTKRHYYIDGTSPHLAELLSDAEYYASEFGPDWADGGPIRMSAKATVKALRDPR